jgi:hypothetical protein
VLCAALRPCPFWTLPLLGSPPRRAKHPCSSSTKSAGPTTHGRATLTVHKLRTDDPISNAIRAHGEAFSTYLDVRTLKECIEQRKRDNLPYDKTGLAVAEAGEHASRAELVKVESALRVPETLPGLLAVLRYRKEMALDGYDLFDYRNLQTLLDSIRRCLERTILALENEPPMQGPLGSPKTAARRAGIGSN